MSLGILKRVFTVRNAVNRSFNLSATRNSSTIYYRAPPGPPDKPALYVAEIMGGLMWWWILWHVWSEPEHIYGEFPMPDAKKWTDAELGIPPDDYD